MSDVHHATSRCGCAPRAARLEDVVADLAGLTLAVLGGGVSATRRVVERLAWGRARCCGPVQYEGDCCTVHHHYRYSCDPPCPGGSCP